MCPAAPVLLEVSCYVMGCFPTAEGTKLYEEDKQLALLLCLVVTCSLKVQLLSLQILGFH